MEASQNAQNDVSPAIANNLNSRENHQRARDLPQPEQTYLNQLVDILHKLLGQQLVAVYLFGSAGYGEYDPGISDLDVQAVVTGPLNQQTSQNIANKLTSKNLPCPARRLEFVVYAQEKIKPATRHPQFELNFNTGGNDPDHLVIDPAHEASHWFLLDIVMGRALGRSLLGPHPSEVFGEIPPSWQLEAIADSLHWHSTHEQTSANSVLNACRGWRYAATCKLGSKRAGAIWAQQQPNCPPVVVQALQGRRDGASLDSTAVSALIEVVTHAVQVAIRNERSSS